MSPRSRLHAWLSRALPAIALLACVFALPADASETGYFEAVGDTDSIPDGVVTALAEDRAGFLWIGTSNGLVRFDGYRPRRYANVPGDPQSLGGNLVRALFAASDGRLWIGTDVNGLSVHDPRSERFTNFEHRADDPQSISAGALYGFAEDADGRVWVGSRAGGLDRVDVDSGRVEHFGASPGLTDTRINVLRFDRSGRLWIGTLSGLLRFDPETATAVPLAAGAADSRTLREPVYSLFQSRDGALWAGSRAGTLLKIDPDRAEVVAVPGRDAGSAIDSASVFSFAEPRPGELWIGRANGIEVRATGDGELLRRYRHDPAVRSSLAGDDIRALLVDRAGLLWTGGFGGGLQRHDPNNRAVRVLRGQAGFGEVLARPNVVSILPLADGHIWLGTRGRGIAVLDASFTLVDGFAPDDPATGLKAGWITSLAQTPDGTIWLGSREGVHRFDAAARRFVDYRGDRGLPNQSARRLLADADGTLWAGTGDGLFRKPAGSDMFERMTLPAGDALAGEINALVRDDADRLWAGGARGLFVLEPGATTLQRVHSPAGAALGHESVLGLLADSRQRLWVDTPAGLYQRQDQHGAEVAFAAIEPLKGRVGSDFGANLLEDAEGRIWSHRYVFDPSSRELHALTRTDGVDFGTGWFRAYARLDDGRMLFGGSEGLLLIDPAVFRPWTYAPPLVVTELRVAGQAQPFDPAGMVLTPAQRSFSVEFAALDFSAPERNRYSHRLLGFDDDWTHTDAAYRVARYSNLWPGSYRLQILGSNRSGRFSDTPLEIPITVLPAWWQTPWAAMLAALLLGLLVVSTVRLRTARMARRALELQSLVERRTGELSLSKQRAEQALSELQGAQRQLVAAEKMASLGQLVAGVAHEINTPIGIAVTAASHLEDATRDCRGKLDENRLTRNDLRQWQDTVDEATRLIQGSLQRAHELVGSFKRVAVDQSSEQRRRFELAEFLHEVQFALQPSYRRTGHTLEVDCPSGIVLDTFPGALFQILTNFVTNSLLHAFAERKGGGTMRISASRVGDTVVLRYRDDGIGMPAEVAARAFDPFFTTRRGSGGSGLGLHLVYNLATQLLGGTVELHSSPGNGSEFELRIPLEAPVRRGLANA